MSGKFLVSHHVRASGIYHGRSQIQCWVSGHRAKSQGTPRPAALGLWPAVLCVGKGSQEVIRARPAVFIRLKLTNIRPCGGMSLHRNKVTSLDFERKVVFTLESHKSLTLCITVPPELAQTAPELSKTVSLWSQAGCIQQTLLQGMIWEGCGQGC